MSKKEEEGRSRTGLMPTLALTFAKRADRDGGGGEWAPDTDEEKNLGSSGTAGPASPSPLVCCRCLNDVKCPAPLSSIEDENST